MNSTQVTELGRFGTTVLARYCGSTIATQFYQEDYPMLLTEHEMAFISMQLMTEFMVSTCIAIFFQLTFSMYLRWCKCTDSSECATDDNVPQNNAVNEPSFRLKIGQFAVPNKPLKTWTDVDIKSWINHSYISDQEIFKAAVFENLQGKDGSHLASITNEQEFIEMFKYLPPIICHELYSDFEIFSGLSGLLGTEDVTTTVQSKPSVTKKQKERGRSCIISVLLVICIVWSYLLALIVMIHYFHQLHQYFKFVGDTVRFTANSTEVLEAQLQSYVSLQDCESGGVGRLACPHLFDAFEDVEAEDDSDDNVFLEPYPLETAEHACLIIYNAMVIANPTLFKYACFSSFVIMDWFLYQLIMLMVGCIPIFLCNCRACLACSCCCRGCASRNSLFCPRCCCEIACCEVCSCGCCCYCFYGWFGCIGWTLQWVFALFIAIFAAFVIYFAAALGMGGLTAVMYAMFFVVTLPLCLWNRNRFRSLLNEEDVELKVKEMEWRDRWIHYDFVQWMCPMYPDHWCDPMELRSLFNVGLILFGVVWMILMIAGVQSLVSTWVVLYVVDGPVYVPWQYFEPFYHGVKDYIVFLVDAIPNCDWDDLSYILMASRSFIEFSPKQSDEFKYALLFHRTVVHTLFGFVCVLVYHL